MGMHIIRPVNIYMHTHSTMESRSTFKGCDRLIILELDIYHFQSQDCVFPCNILALIIATLAPAQ